MLGFSLALRSLTFLCAPKEEAMHSSPEAHSAEAPRRDRHKQEHNPRTPADRSATSQTQSASFQLSAYVTTVITVPLRHTQSLTASRGWVQLPPMHPETPQAGTSPAGTGNSHACHTAQYSFALPRTPLDFTQLADAGSWLHICLAHPSRQGRFGSSTLGKRVTTFL